MNGSKSPHPLLSLIVPTHNDSGIIQTTLAKIEEALAKQNMTSYEVVVVDDGSTDSTRQEVEKTIQKNPSRAVRLVHYDKNQGKGFAVATGMLGAQGDYRLFTDADLSTPLDSVTPFIEALKGGADIVIASRFMQGSRIVVERPPLIRFLSFCERLMIWSLSGVLLSDTQCGFKGFRKEAAEAIFSRQKIRRFCFDVEVLFLAKRWGYKIKVLPVNWHHDADTRVRPRDWFIFIADLFRLRWHWLTKAYEHR